MRKNEILLLIMFSYVIVGCDTIHGVTRVSTFEPMPSTECVLMAVNSIDDVAEVAYSIEEGGRPLTWHGIEKPDVIHRYWYYYKAIKNNFFLSESYNGQVTLQHGYGCLNCYPPQEIIDIIYPFIVSLEKELEAQCNIQGLISNSKEYCSGIKCPNA